MNKNSPLRDGRSANPLLISPRWAIRPQHVRLCLTFLGTASAILFAVDRSLAAIEETEFVPWSGLEAFAGETLRSLSASVSSIRSPKAEFGRVTAAPVAALPN